MLLTGKEENERLIKDYVDRETAVQNMQVELAVTAIMQGQEDMRNAEKLGLETRKHKKAFREVFNAMGDSISDLESSDNEEGGEGKEDDDEDTELGKMSEYDEPSWVMGTISQTRQKDRESIRLTQMTLDEWTQLGWEDTTGMGGHSKPAPGERNEVQDGQSDCSRRRNAANWQSCTRTCTGTILTAYRDCWYFLRKIANPTWVFSTRK